jgi:arabinofuranosyltransferase
MTRPRYTLLVTGARACSAELGAGAVLLVGLLAWPYTVDDAFIVARYACNLAAGRGYGINPQQTSDGVTGPLWLLPQVLACGSQIDPIATSKLLGLGCAVLASWLLLRRLRERSLGSRAAMAGALMLAVSPSIGTWAIAGLETGAALLLVTCAALAATQRPGPRPLALGACVAMLAWLRPELALCCVVLLVHVVRRDRRAAALAALCAALGAGSVLAFRLSLFGDVLPLSFSAKAGSLAQGLRYTGLAVALSTSLVGAFLAYSAAHDARGDDRMLGLAVAAQLAAIVLAGGDWMPGYRLLVPVLPLYIWLASSEVARRSLRAPRRAALLLALACVLPVLDLATRVPNLRDSGRGRARAAELASFLRARTRKVALVDVGYLAYESGVEVIDLGGLTDARIASMPGGHLSKRIDAGYLERRAPDAIVLHSATTPTVDADGRLRRFSGFEVEQRVAAMSFVRKRYRVDHVIRYESHYYYILLMRRAELRPAAVSEGEQRQADQIEQRGAAGSYLVVAAHWAQQAEVERPARVGR